MKSIIIAALALGASARAPRSHELDHSYSYETYIKDFSKSFCPMAKEIFARNLAEILEHNARKGMSWTKGVNQFMDVEAPPRGMHSGVLRQHIKEHRAKRTADAANLPFEVEAASNLPSSVDWREKGVVTAVKDQGGCGSCWAFATTAVMESHIAIETGYLFDMSPQELVSCMPNTETCGGTGGCEGAIAELGFQYYMDKGGVVQEYQMGYTSYYGDDGECYITNGDDTARRLRGAPTGPDPSGISTGVANIKNYTVLPTNDELALMNAVAKVGPISITVAAMSWHLYEGGVYDPEVYDADLDHAVTLVGYGNDEASGKDYWLVRNSWSPTYGEHGYIRLARSTACGTDTTPADGIACTGDPDTMQVCGTSGMLADSVFLSGGYLL